MCIIVYRILTLGIFKIVEENRYNLAPMSDNLWGSDFEGFFVGDNFAWLCNNSSI